MRVSLRGPVWFLITLLVLGSLVLVGCSRSATADLLPDNQGQEEEIGGTDLDMDAQNATMQALLSSGLTQTAAVPDVEQPVEETPQPLVESGEGLMVDGGSDSSSESPDDGAAANVESEETSEPAETVGAAEVPSEVVSEGVEVVEADVQEVEGDAAILTEPAFTLPTTYIVQEGDWIFMIAREFNIEPREIISANPGFDPNTVLPGQELLIPNPAQSEGEPLAPVQELGTAAVVGSASAEIKPDTYIVEVGDTVFSIGLKHNVTYADLATANDISAPYLVYPGQVLAIP